MTWHPNSAHARAAASTKTSSLHHVHLPPSPTHTPPPVQPLLSKCLCMVMALAEPLEDGVKDACAHGGNTSSRASSQRFSQPCITAVMWGSAQHEAPRGQKKTEEEEAGLETHSGLRAPTFLPPRIRPASLAEPPGHRSESRGPAPHGVQILDAPVPQSGDQLVETLTNDVELAIEVPKIFLVCCSWWNSRWVCQFRSGPSWHATETWRAAFRAGPPWGRLMVGYSTLQVVSSPGITASTRRYINTGQGGRFSTRPCIWQSLV